jgi:hypothetical protein
LARDIGPYLNNYVILEDPNKNQIEISVEKRNSKIYFAHGWTRLRHFYRLNPGAWITLLYMNPALFKIKVWRITGAEVTYPKTDPPQKLLLPKQHNQCFPSRPVTYFVSPSRFIHTLEKTLDPSDVGSGILVSTFSHTIYNSTSTSKF